MDLNYAALGVTQVKEREKVLRKVEKWGVTLIRLGGIGRRKGYRYIRLRGIIRSISTVVIAFPHLDIQR